MAQSWTVLHASLLKIALIQRYFFEEIHYNCRTEILKMHQDGCFWGKIYPAGTYLLLVQIVY